MSFYDVTLTDMNKVLDLAIGFSSNNTAFSELTATTLEMQATGYLNSMTALLNQTIGGKYVFSGARYNTAPVANLANLPLPALPYTAVSNPDLPFYDSEYTGAGSQNAFAYVTAKSTIDENYVLDYGITSNEPAFQKIIWGMRLMQEAGREGAAGNEAAYHSYLQEATLLLRQASLELQSLHTTVVGNNYLAESQKQSQTTMMMNITNQLAAIQQVDRNEVAVKITDLTANLQASYSVTGTLLKLSILNYL